MKPLAAAAIVLALAYAAPGAEPRVRIAPNAAGTAVDVTLVEASARQALDALAMRAGGSVSFEAVDRPVTLSVSGLKAAAAMERVARAAKLTIERDGIRWIVRDPAEPVLSLDVKDADVREIVREIRAQCGIRNVMIDPGVEGKGTFLFDRVPCSIAMRTVFASLGLDAEFHAGSVVRVGERR